MPLKTDVLILGGGLAGLSTAYHLGRRSRLSVLIVEKEARPGGTAGSVERDGFVFDHTGHLLHLHDAYGMKLVLSLLGGNLTVHQRSSWIYSHESFTRYPFQANTYGLPDRVVEDCVAGFLRTIHRPDARPLGYRPSFREWCLRTFGEGISRHFMLPYNRKLWRTDLSRLTTEWQGRFVPKPSAGEVLLGSLSDQRTGFGYNATFRYPARGGIQALPDALAARLAPGQLRASSPVLSVDLEERSAVVGGLGEVRYRRLVNTLPLPLFLDLCSRLPLPVRQARRVLRWNAVYCLNLGVKGDALPGRHWVYFPESRYPFYRVGCQSNFSRFVAPPGASSLYVEVSRRPDEAVDLARLERQVLEGLRASGILKPGGKLLARAWMPIPCAYVVYDFARTPAVERIMAHLASRGVESIGRYGAWKYSFMEETLLDGRSCAERLGGRRESREAAAETELKPLR